MTLDSDLGMFRARSAFYMGKLSPTCSCFKTSYCSSVPSVLDEDQSTAAPSALFWSESEKLDPLVNCHQS